MNPPPRLSPNPFVEFHGCDGDGCASDPDTWPLHHVIRGGAHCHFCCSCILLSNRSLYCCHCFFLVCSPSCHYDNGDKLMAPPAPTVTCQVCREAVVHLPCLDPTNGVFVCPPGTAAQNGRPFSYAPPCRRPIDKCEARVLVIVARIALAMLKRHANAARAAADRLQEEARDARTRAREALRVALDLGAQEDPSWVLPPSPENDLAPSEEQGNQDEANVGEVLLVRRNALPLPPLSTLTIGTVASVVPMPMAPAEAKHMPPSSQSKPLFDLNENAAPENEAKAAQAQVKPKRGHALNSSDVKEMAMAAAEAARSIPPTPPTLQLFPSAKASSSTKKSRKLQLFNDDEEM